VIGDLAAATSRGAPVPAVATAANQMGRAAARNIRATLAGRPRAPFVYRDKGSLAVIGRRKAIAQVGRLRAAGPVAFLLWALVHVVYLVGSRNRARVLATWIYSGVTYRRSARLITGVGSPLARGAREAYPGVVNQTVKTHG
jgi:NADH dehydrogenase